MNARNLRRGLQRSGLIQNIWKQGVAAELISRARQHAAALGYATCYLCATTEKRPYYLKQGFTLLEEDVTGLDVFSIKAV